MTSVGIIGASGFGGVELLRLVATHPELDLRFATGDSQAGQPLTGLYPSLAAAYPGQVFSAYDAALVDDVDLVFLALPHGASQQIVPEIVDRARWIVDLGADFRLVDPTLYETWYGGAHARPDLLETFAYGLPELFRDEIKRTDRVAVPGCYPTSAALPLAPLVRAGLIETDGIVVDAASGVSGAGRDRFPFCATDEDFVAYGLDGHRHTPEIEQAIGAPVVFTPHLVPMSRGMLATCYARPAGTIDTAALLDFYAETYAGEPFVVVGPDAPHTKATQGANTAHLTARVDERTGFIVALCAIDNLGKGASGQAVQCANILLGLPETTALPLIGLHP